MIAPMTRLVFSLRSQLKESKEVNRRLLMHVAKQEAVITEAIARRDEAFDLVADLRADLEALQAQCVWLMEATPTDLREMT